MNSHFAFLLLVYYSCWMSYTWLEILVPFSFGSYLVTLFEHKCNLPATNQTEKIASFLSYLSKVLVPPLFVSKILDQSLSDALYFPLIAFPCFSLRLLSRTGMHLFSKYLKYPTCTICQAKVHPCCPENTQLIQGAPWHDSRLFLSPVLCILVPEFDWPQYSLVSISMMLHH